MFAFLSKLVRRREPERVAFDEQGVTRRLSNGKLESLRWSELKEISLVTTDAGPYLDDVLWVLIGDSGGCLVPSTTEGAGELLSRLQELPGFDNMAVVRAMGSTENAHFLVWRRAEAGGSASQAT